MSNLEDLRVVDLTDQARATEQDQAGSTLRNRVPENRPANYPVSDVKSLSEVKSLQTSGAGADERRNPEVDRRARRRVPLRRQLVNLALISSAISIPFLATGRGTMLIIIAALAFFIMFHEFAHFAVAKLCGMKVTEFFIGFGPRIFSFRRGETEYGIKAIPAGGYVKIVGMNSAEEVNEADEARTYRQSTWPRRFAAIIAGPASHFLVAFVLLVVMFFATGVPEGLRPIIGEVTPGSPAATAGIAAGDTIVSIDGQPVKNYDDVMVGLKKEVGVPITLELRRGDTVKTVTVSRRMMTIENEQRPLIGIAPLRTNDGVITTKYPFGQSITKAGSELKRYSTGTVVGMASFFRPSNISKLADQVIGANSAEGPITEQELQSRPTSVVGMVSLGSQAAKSHPAEVLSLLALINLALGAFNLLPMLPLDGGHIVIATYEAVVSRIKGKRHLVNINRVAPFAALFMAFILLLGLSAMYLDIVRPVS